MKSISFTCEFVTPAFIGNADPRDCELRPSAIKAALRFWWRALNPDLVLPTMTHGWDYSKMGLYEQLIFGGTNTKWFSGGDEKGGSRSSVILSIPTHHLKSGRHALVPHKIVNGRPISAEGFDPQQEFQVVVGLPDSAVEYNNDVIITSDQLKSLFAIASALGGLGKRSRKAMGGWKVNEPTEYRCCNLEDLYRHIEVVKPGKYQLNPRANGITTLFVASPNYPFVKGIRIGKIRHARDIVGNVDATIQSFHRSSDRMMYENTLGKAAGNTRWASPVIVSGLKVKDDDFLTVITILNASHEYASDSGHFDLRLQTDFINAILQ